MNAKEMFEKLGYELTIENTVFGGQILYYKKENDYGYEHIDFREGSVNRLIKIYYESFKLNKSDKSLKLEELQAINKQIKELGWLNE